MERGFDILHEDAACLVVNKPGGLLTQAPLGIDSLEVRVKQMLRQRDLLTGDVYLGVPHRLDRPVSGAIVFAKTKRAARKISDQFERRRVEKTYWALVPGRLSVPAGTWTDTLKKVDGDPRSVVTSADDPQGQLAILHYRVVYEFPQLLFGQTFEIAADKDLPGPFSLLEIRLETGRTHQIRIQCASRGHALLGDEMYHSPFHFGPPTLDERMRMTALHARSLTVWTPATNSPLTCIAPLPPYWPVLEKQ